MQRNVDGLLREDYNLTNLVMQSPVAMALLFGRDHIIQLMNVKALDLLGHEINTLLNRPAFEAMPELRGQGLETIFEEVFTSGKPFTANELALQLIYHGSPCKRFVNVTFQPLTNEYHEVIGIVATAVDITEQVASKRLIQESERKYKGLFHSMSQGFCIIKLVFDKENNPIDYIFLEVNDAFYNYTPVRDILCKSAASLAKGNLGFWLDIFGKVAQTGKDITVTGNGVMNTGQYFEVYAYPVSNHQVALLFTDISERRKNEELQKEFNLQLKALVDQRTEELQKLNENLQQFAHIASHDLKEPTRKIISYSRLLIEDELPEDTRLSFLNNIHKSGNRLASTIDDILKYSTNDQYFEEEFKEVDLNDILNDIVTDLELKIENVKAVLKISELPVIKGSRILLYQLFYNLISNSLKFINPQVTSTIVLSARNSIIDNYKVTEITLSDNGVGFEQKYAEKIFEKFSRLNAKDKYEGTGLGLALCKRIAERHSGTITALGIPNVGAVFTILLPVNQ
ncbi:MAG: ATP-binding protein [Chloroflexota bacterium]